MYDAHDATPLPACLCACRYVDPTDSKLSGAFHQRIDALSGNTDGNGIGVNASGHTDMEGAMESLLGLESTPGALGTPACYTCAVEQPVRSRHCRTCRRCVRAFDHHCPFVGNCVGAGNYRWFFSYLVLFDLRYAEQVMRGFQGNCIVCRTVWDL